MQLPKYFQKNFSNITQNRTFRQFLILTWKNFLILKRKPFGPLVEILLSFFFLSFILILRNYVEIIYFPPNSNPTYNIIDFFYKTASQDLVLFYPDTPVIQNVVYRAFRVIKSQKYWLNLSSTNDSQVTNFNVYTANRLLAFIAFPSDYETKLPNKVEYSITTREQNEFIYNVENFFYPKKEFMFGKSPEQLCNDNKYFRLYNTFNSIKYALDLSIIQEMTRMPMNDPKNLKIQQIGCSGYLNDELKSSFGFLIPLLIQLGYLIPLINTIGQIVREKQTKMNEYLKIIGIKPFVYKLSYFIRLGLVYVLMSLMVAFYCTLELEPKRPEERLTKKVLLKHVQSYVLFLTMMCYSIQCSLFALFVSVFFTKPLVAKLVVILIWTLTGVNLYNDLENIWRYLLCMFPNTGLILSFQIFYQYERSEVNLVNLFSGLYDTNFNIGNVLISMIIWSTMLVPFMWYFEKVVPSQFGIPMPFYFLIQPSYWSNLFRYRKLDNNKDWSKNYALNDQNGSESTVTFCDVTKNFHRGSKKKSAIKNLNLNFNENEIISLLGHNGAGKIKEYSLNEVDAEIQKIASLLNLEDFIDKRAKNLSGGTKKRLGIAMALIGDPKIIILDEPSSGIDPKNRRQLWNIIKKFKLNKTIIISTHYMKEADYLSDKIGILNKGKLKCFGNPKFLKSKFCQGYKLVVRKTENFNEIVFKNIIELFDENYLVDNNYHNEISVYVNSDSSKDIYEFLKNIEDNRVYIGFESYTISSPTLEEVFIKLGKLHDENGNHIYNSKPEIDSRDIARVFNNEMVKVSGIRLFIQQIGALLKKRFRISTCRYLLTLTVLILPLIIQTTSTALIPSKTNLVNSNDNNLQYSGQVNLEIGNYGNFRMPYQIINDSYSKIPLQSLIQKFYTRENKPNVQLLEVKSESNMSEFIRKEKAKDINNQINDLFMAISFNITNWDKFQATLFYSSLAFHSSGTILNEVSNLLLTFLSNDLTKSISTTNAPLKSNNSLYRGGDLFEFLACLDIVPGSILNLIVSVICGFLIAANVINVSRELISGSKKLQFLSRTNIFTYWFCNYIYDIITFLCIYIGVVCSIKIVDAIRNDVLIESAVLVSQSNIFYVFFLLICSALPSCSLSYIWSFFFKTEIVAFITLFIMLSSGVVLDMLCSFLQLFINSDPYERNKSLFDFLNLVKNVLYLLFPNVTVKRGLYFLKIRNNKNCMEFSNRLMATNFKMDSSRLSFEQPGLGSLILIFFFQFIIGNLLILALELRNRIDLNTFKKKTNINEDGTLVLKDVSKKYGWKKKLILKDIDLSVKDSECFGILGINGAGKTTLLKTIIGELKPNSGRIIVNGAEIGKNILKYPNNLGYCPQFSYLPEFLKVYQCFEMFAVLKGIDPKCKIFITNDLVKIFKLDIYRDVYIKDLSEGNKRKLSTAIAFLGNPKLPTTGMDPSAKTYFWNLIKMSENYGITTIISSHSLEECEKLCSSLSILKESVLEFCGTFDNLKLNYGKGFCLMIKLEQTDEPSNDLEILESFLLRKIPNSTIKEKQADSFLVQIKKTEFTNLLISDLFNLVEKYKKKYKIESFSISETTLEEIFLSISESNTKIDQNSNIRV
uniref:ATP-binding cassette transporter subfamily A member 3-like protein X3 n=1 Tax=Brachionus rotundiformis TaxID=96890 RepID=A0A7H9SKR7_9BILA|nr:ATP-binding cassette transporter subfamily A member 3-like protein X3 [Brachionus rotundiformis]